MYQGFFFSHLCIPAIVVIVIKGVIKKADQKIGLIEWR